MQYTIAQTCFAFAVFVLFMKGRYIKCVEREGKNMAGKRNDDDIFEMKQGIYTNEEVRDVEYSNSFTMEYNGGEINAITLGRKFGFEFKHRILDRFYIFTKYGVPDRSKYKIPLPVATMRSFDKKLVRMTQAQIELFSNNLEVTTRVERDITNADLDAEWYFREGASMGVYEAWSRGYTGKGIILTMASEGVQLDHPALADNFNVSLGYDYILDIPGGYNVADTDIAGTLLAGVAAGVNNNECVTGLAYEATFASLRLLSENAFLSDLAIAQTLTHRLDVADIHVRTWSYGRDGLLYKYFTTLERSAVEKGISEGRGGKGLIYVTGTLLTNYQEDCNTDPFPSSRYFITANAVRSDGSFLDLAEQCTNVMVSAYAGVFGSYGGRMTSTYVDSGCGFVQGSALAPMFVSSAVALTLQANNKLTYRDVQHIIIETASPDAISGVDFIVNGAGKKVSPSAGFGLVNVSAMVRAAETWKTVPDLVTCAGPLLSPSICCDDNLGHNFTVDQCHINYVEHVEIYVHFKTVWREYTEIHLISPQGTDNRIMRQRPKDHLTKARTHTFTSLQNWGENPTGNWTLMLKNLLPCENVMYLYDWSLTIYGTVTDPRLGTPANGTLGGHYTDESPCQPGTYPLVDVDICIDCDLSAYRVVNGICAKDGGPLGYCDDIIECTDATWCNDSICNQCQDGYHGYGGECFDDGRLGGKCDGNIICEPVGSTIACDDKTLRCINCTNGWRPIDGLCVQDGHFFGYCDENIPCVEEIYIGGVLQDFGCVTSVHRCDVCDIYIYHTLINSVCIKDGTLGGKCNPIIPCTTSGTGCNITTGLCTDCTMDGYRYWNYYCLKDGMLDGYCSKDISCTDGTSCDPVTQTCVECTPVNYRVLNGFCVQDGYLNGYCSDVVPCILDNSACLMSKNICVNCLEKDYVVDGFCILADEKPEESEDSDPGILAGIGISAVVVGVICTLIGSYLLMKKFMMPQIKPGSTTKVTIINVMSKQE